MQSSFRLGKKRVGAFFLFAFPHCVAHVRRYALFSITDKVRAVSVPSFYKLMGFTPVELVRRSAHRRPHRRQHRQHPLRLFLPRRHDLARSARTAERQRRTRSDRRPDILCRARPRGSGSAAAERRINDRRKYIASDTIIQDHSRCAR